MTLRQAAEYALQFIDRTRCEHHDSRLIPHGERGPIATALAEALDAPDLTEQLVDLLRSIVHECDAVFIDTGDMSEEWRELDKRARELLALYDARYTSQSGG